MFSPQPALNRTKMSATSGIVDISLFDTSCLGTETRPEGRGRRESGPEGRSSLRKPGNAQSSTGTTVQTVLIVQ